MNLFTICSKNYLSRAILLCESVCRHNNSIDRFIFLTDITPLDPLIIEKLQKEKIQIFYINQLNISEKYLFNIISKYNITELNTAIKPFCFKKLFSLNKKHVIYFDPDIEIFCDISSMNKILNTNSAIVTPHMLSPLPDDNNYPKNHDILLSGIFNFGFLALKKTNETEMFIDWWSRQLLELCFNDLDNGLFTDQKIGTFIINFISSTFVSYDVGWNVAYWNLHERKLSKKNNIILVNNKFPLVFFHYSGLNLNDPKKLSQHQNRYKSTINPNLKKIIEDYAKHNIRITSKYKLENLKNDFQLFDNDKKVSQIYHTALRISNHSLQFNTEGKLIFDKTIFYKKKYLNFSLSVNHKIEVFCEPIIGAIIYLRKDLLELFNFNKFKYPSDYYVWFINGGYKDFGLDHHGFNNENISNGNWFVNKKIIQILKQSVPINLKRKIKYYLNISRIIKPKILRLDDRSKIIEIYNKKFQTIAENNFLHNSSINYLGYFEYASGLSTAARNLCNLFSSTKKLSSYQNLEMKNKKKICKFSPKVYPKKNRIINFYHCNLDMIEFYIIPKKNNSDINVLYCVWELPIFPSEWISSLKNIDLIITPSKFVSDNLFKSWGIHSFVLPHSINLETVNPTITNTILSKYKISNNNLKILISLDFDSFINRKNPLTALLAIKEIQYQKSLTIQTDIILKTNNMIKTKKFLNDNSLKIKNLKIIADELSIEENTALKIISDIYISTHRSEGFGLNIAEMMFLKKIVIATNYSANLDFCNNENSFLINYNLHKVKRGDYPFYQNQFWSNPSVSHTQEILFEIINNFKKLDKIRQNAYQTIYKMNEEVLSFISGKTDLKFKFINKNFIEH